MDLRTEDFVAQGGQGRVFVRGDVALKIFADPALAPPARKLAHLRRLVGPHVAAPADEVTDAHGTRVGYTMPFFAGAHSWAQLCAPAFRSRAGLDDRAALGLVRSLGAALHAVHRHGVLVVDLSENNVLVRGNEVCLIDLDSWQTPHHPATALTPTIASPHAPAGRFDEATDWFAYAVLCTSLLLGMHPFKGRHPRVHGLRDRMRAGISAFDPSVRTPPACADPASIPEALRVWLRGVLERGAGGPPPLGPLPSPTRAQADDARGDYPDPIRWVFVEGARVFVATATAAFEGPRCWHDDGRPIRALGRAHGGAAFVVVDGIAGLEVRVQGCTATSKLALAVDDLVAHEGRVFVRARGRILELQIRCLGDRPLLLTREVARVMPHATRLFPGVAVQDVLGRRCASLLGHPRGAPQIELAPEAVLDARRAGDRLVVLTHRDRVISRHDIRLTRAGAIHEHAVEVGVEPWGTAFINIGAEYAEVGPRGIRWGESHRSGPWRALPPALRGASLHGDGRRVLASAGQMLRELRPPAPGVDALGFDATRCR